MEHRDENESTATTHGPAFREECGEVGDGVEHQTAHHAIEELVGERPRPGEIVRDEPNAVPSGFASSLRDHPVTEVHGGDTRARRREADGVTTRAAAEIDDVQAADVAEQ